MNDTGMRKPTIFISYAHEDKAWLDIVLKYLGVALEEYDAELWSDRDLPAGSHWEEKLFAAMERATLAILLVSVESLHKESFVRKAELPFLKDKRKIPIIPIIVRQCPWQHQSWLRALQVLPKEGKALSGFSKPDLEEEMTRIAGVVVANIARGEPQRGLPQRHLDRAASRRAPSPIPSTAAVADKDAGYRADLDRGAMAGARPPGIAHFGSPFPYTNYRVNFTGPKTNRAQATKDDRR